MEQKSNTFGILSLVFACLSFVIFPPLFGLLGVVFSIIGISKKEGVLAIIGLIFSILFAIAGALIGQFIFERMYQ